MKQKDKNRFGLNRINFSISTVKILISFVALHFSFSLEIKAQTSPRVNIQGVLKDNNGNILPDGEYLVTFQLYNVPTGGTALWNEEVSISVAGGIYNHNLGSVTPLNGSNFINTLYASVKIGAYELSPRTELTYAPYALSVREEGCSGAVGDIKYSILNPTQFASVNGNCWVPMDGRVISNSRLNTISGLNNIPNGGGLFIRSQEFQGSADRDPERNSNSQIASVQNDLLLTHNHSVNDPGHSHNYQDDRHQENFVQTYGAGLYGDNPVAHFLTTEVFSITGSANPSITMQNNVGTETRPKNLNLWVYIRVN